MKTRKLVLGVCVLAAVTGDFWGNAATDGAALEFKYFWLPLHMLTNAIPDNESRAQYEQALKATQQRTQTDVATFASIGFCELGLVRSALSKERRAYLIDEVVARSVKPVEMKVERLKCALSKAEKARDEARHFVWWKEAKVNRLKLKLEKAKLQNTAIRAKFADLESTAARLIEEAREARKQASVLYGRRVEFVTKLRDAAVLRSAGIDADQRRVGDSGVTIQDLEEIAGRAVQNVEYVTEQARIRGYVASFAKCIHDIDLENDYDYTRFRDETGGGYWLYRKLNASFCEQGRGYNSDGKTFAALLDQASTALSHAWYLAHSACNLAEQRANEQRARAALADAAQSPSP